MEYLEKNHFTDSDIQIEIYEHKNAVYADSLKLDSQSPKTAFSCSKFCPVRTQSTEYFALRSSPHFFITRPSFFLFFSLSLLPCLLSAYPSHSFRLTFIHTVIHSSVRNQRYNVTNADTCTFKLDACLSVHHCICVEKKTQLNANEIVYCTYNTPNMFRALLCPSSRTRDYMCVITAYGVQCLGCWLSEVKWKTAGYGSRMRDVGRLASSYIPHPALHLTSDNKQPRHCTP